MDLIFRLLLYFSAIFFPYLLIKVLLLARDFIKKERGISRLEEEYENLVSCRNDMLQHYSWSLEEKNKEITERLKTDIVKITKEIEYIQSEYEKRYNAKSLRKKKES